MKINDKLVERLTNMSPLECMIAAANRKARRDKTSNEIVQDIILAAKLCGHSELGEKNDSIEM